MDIHTVTVKIIGIKPLIQSNPHGMWKDPPAEGESLTPLPGKKKLRGSDSEDFLTAASQLYRNEAGEYYHPAIVFWTNLLRACEGRKIGSDNALSVITRAVALMTEEFVLYDPVTLDAKVPKRMRGTEWQIDYRRAVNHNKKTSEGGVGVVAIRPKWKDWGGFLVLEIDHDIFRSTNALIQLLNIAGHQYGIGVGRMRVKAVVYMRPIWSGFGSGKYSAELVS